MTIINLASHLADSVALVASGDSHWRAAVLAVHAAQTRYLDLLRSTEEVDDRTLELAWLDLYRAEQRRDSIVYRVGP